MSIQNAMAVPGVDALGNPLAHGMDATMLIMQQMQYGAQAGMLGYPPTPTLAPGALATGALVPAGLTSSPGLPMLPGLGSLAGGIAAAANLPELARKDVEQLCLRFGITGAIKEELFVEMGKRVETFDTDLRLLERSLAGARTPAGMLSVKLNEMRAGRFGQVGECGDFRKGLCTRGEACRYSHTRPGVPANLGAASAITAAVLSGTSAVPSAALAGFEPPATLMSEHQKRQLDQFAVRFKLDTLMQQEVALEMQKRLATFDQDLNVLSRVLEKALVPSGLLCVKLREMREGRFGGCAPTELCGDFRKGLCSRGDACRYSHGQGLPMPQGLQVPQLPLLPQPLQAAPALQPSALSGALSGAGIGTSGSASNFAGVGMTGAVAPLSVADTSAVSDASPQVREPEPLSRLGPPGGGWDSRKRASPKRDGRSRSRSGRSRSRDREEPEAPSAKLPVELERISAANAFPAAAAEATDALPGSKAPSNDSNQPSSTFEALLGPDALALPPPAARPAPDFVENAFPREAKRAKEREEKVEDREEAMKRKLVNEQDLEKARRLEVPERRPLGGAMKELDNMLKAESDDSKRVVGRSLGAAAGKAAKDAGQSDGSPPLDKQERLERRNCNPSRDRDRKENPVKDIRKDDRSRGAHGRSRSQGRKDDRSRRERGERDRSRSRDTKHARGRSRSRDTKAVRGRSRKQSQNQARSRDRKDRGSSRKRSHSRNRRSRSRKHSRSRKRSSVCSPDKKVRSRSRQRDRKDDRRVRSRSRDRDRKDANSQKDNDQNKGRDRKVDRDEKEGRDRRDHKECSRSRNEKYGKKSHSRSVCKKDQKGHKGCVRSQSRRQGASSTKSNDKKDKDDKDKDRQVKERMDSKRTDIKTCRSSKSKSRSESPIKKPPAKKDRKVSSSSSSPSRVKKKKEQGDDSSDEGKKKSKAKSDESSHDSNKKSKKAKLGKDSKQKKAKKSQSGRSESQKNKAKKAKGRQAKAKKDDSSSEDAGSKAKHASSSESSS